MGSQALKIVYKDNFSYLGEQLNGIPHGKGYVQFCEDSQNTNRKPKNQIVLKLIKNVKGIFKDGKIQNCQFTTSNAYNYQGQLDQKQQISNNVKGILNDKTNVRYAGQFDKGRLIKGKIDSSQNTDKQNQYICFTNGEYKGTSILDGKGYFYNISQKYMAIGQFKKGNLQRGTYIYGTGNYYQGQFAHGSPNGQGLYSKINNFNQIDKIISQKQFENLPKIQCKTHIQNLLRLYQTKPFIDSKLNNFSYEGSFKNKQFYGKGYVTFQNGDTYKGKFKSGKIHGKGQYSYFNTKTILKGKFYYGIPSGDFVIQYSYESLINRKKDRENIIQKYQGQIYNGLFHGMGVLHYRNGVIFKGCFTEGAKNGPGVLIYCSNKFKCLYMMNKLIGRLQRIQDQAELD